MNRITVNAVKVLDSLSHETLCFTCNVLWDGKKIGVAENRGEGGMTFIQCTGDAKSFQDASAYAAAMPMLKSDGTQDMDFQGKPEFYTLEDLVDELAGDTHDRKKLAASIKRNWTKKTDFLTGKEHRVANQAFSPALKAWILGKYPDATILNELSYDDAVDRAHAFHKALAKAEADRWSQENANGG